MFRLWKLWKLMFQLRFRDQWHAENAAYALGRLGDVRAVKSLIRALAAGNSDVRLEAVKALGRLGDARAVEPLIRVLWNDPWAGDWRKDVRLAAIRALGQIGDARALEPLIVQLSCAVEWHRANAQSGGNMREERTALITTAEALGRLGDVRAIEPLLHASRCASEAERALVSIGSAAVQPLIDALQGDEFSQRSAAWALGRLGDVRAVEPLIRVLEGSFADAELAAAEALGRLGDARAFEPLLRRLGWGGHWSEIVPEALGRLGDARAADPLIGLLDGDSRVAAAKGLRKLYRAGNLPADAQQAILRHASAMAQPHRDESTPGCGYGYGSHTDVGIGVDL